MLRCSTAVRHALNARTAAARLTITLAVARMTIARLSPQPSTQLTLFTPTALTVLRAQLTRARTCLAVLREQLTRNRVRTALTLRKRNVARGHSFRGRTRCARGHRCAPDSPAPR